MKKFIPPVHLAEGRTEVCRDTPALRAFPLGEAAVGTVRSSRLPGPERVSVILDWLDVESSTRYKCNGSDTFCNVYAFDFCYLAGVYLPRVWWTEDAQKQILSGKDVSVEYGDTVLELSANRLHEWLHQHGNAFGWCAVDTLDQLQLAANTGSCALITAKGRLQSTHGHLSVVCPEIYGAHAIRALGHVISPLQSQAGRKRIRVKCLSKWWDAERFNEYAYWVYTPQLVSEHIRVTQKQKALFGSGVLHPSRGRRPQTLHSRIVELVFSEKTGLLRSSMESFHSIPHTFSSDNLLAALIAAEDCRFYKHSGYDFIGIVRALYMYIARGRIQGASTIEQQLVRTVTDSRSFTLQRKFSEIIIACWLSRRMTKRDIASFYLQVAYFGNGLTGVAHASRKMGYDLSQLRIEDACQIVSALRYPLPKFPSCMQERRRTQRSQYILRKLKEERSRDSPLRSDRLGFFSDWFLPARLFSKTFSRQRAD